MRRLIIIISLATLAAFASALVSSPGYGAAETHSKTAVIPKGVSFPKFELLLFNPKSYARLEIVEVRHH